MWAAYYCVNRFVLRKLQIAFRINGCHPPPVCFGHTLCYQPEVVSSLEMGSLDSYRGSSLFQAERARARSFRSLITDLLNTTDQNLWDYNVNEWIRTGCGTFGPPDILIYSSHELHPVWPMARDCRRYKSKTSGRPKVPYSTSGQKFWISFQMIYGNLANDS